MSLQLETRLQGSAFSRFVQELFGNSARFPIANVIFEILIEGPQYLRAFDLYIILPAGFIQAYWLSRWQVTGRPRRFWGNLIGPSIYTAVELSIEGLDFFTEFNHIAYWGFSILIGLLQTSQPILPPALRELVSILEGIVRASILLALYVAFEAATTTHGYTLGTFFTDDSHIFITLAILLLGLSSGISNTTTQRYLALLRDTSAQLKTYSEWLLGRSLLEQLVNSPAALSTKRRERTVLFMDIRNFTRWSEAHLPEEVAAMLTEYYRIAETALSPQAIKLKFSADEVMGIYADPPTALQAAITLQEQINRFLQTHQLGAGIGLHTGLLVEGLLGGKSVKFYDAIGSTVNIAKRIEGAAGPGEVLLSEKVKSQIDQAARFGAARRIQVKGKEEPLIVFPLQTNSRLAPNA